MAYLEQLDSILRDIEPVAVIIDCDATVRKAVCRVPLFWQGR